jgi:hypothetical protein
MMNRRRDPRMRIPRYWARAEGDTPPDFDGDRSVSVWGWSDDSRVDAERNAQQRLTELLDKLQRGLGLPKGYAYGTRPLREQILEELRDRGGRLEALLTRNAYGSVVLNTAQVLFVDVDARWPSLGQRIARAFGSRKPFPSEATLTRIRDVLQHDSGGSYRIYRTAAGFRVLATDPTFAPTSAEALRLMERLGADQSFVQLCKVQDSFRARLTPKPWRCGQPIPPARFPRDAAGDARFSDWLQAYERAIADKATCRFVEAIGWGRNNAETERIVRLHDERTKAGSDLPLA